MSPTFQDKHKSAKLSELMNPMFLWYPNIKFCYVHLADVQSDEDPSPSYSSFGMSRWFTRGWTLQELLPPSSVKFYTANWIKLATKVTLQDTLSAVTGIASEVIIGGYNVEGYHILPVAVRMPWAADRVTTRQEDIAY
jgi:hypothetical protein